MEHLYGQILAALRAPAGVGGTAHAAQSRATPGRRAEARPAERMDRRRALEAMEQVEGLGLLAATALLLVTFIHGDR